RRRVGERARVRGGKGLIAQLVAVRIGLLLAPLRRRHLLLIAVSVVGVGLRRWEMVSLRGLGGRCRVAAILRLWRPASRLWRGGAERVVPGRSPETRSRWSIRTVRPSHAVPLRFRLLHR